MSINKKRGGLVKDRMGDKGEIKFLDMVDKKKVKILKLEDWKKFMGIKIRKNIEKGDKKESIEKEEIEGRS